MPECLTCPHADKIAFLEKSMEKSDTKNSEQHKEFYEAITDIKLSAKETQSDIKVMKNEMSQMFDLIKTIQSDTTQLKDKPSKKLDAITISLTSSTLAIIISIIINYIINK